MHVTTGLEVGGSERMLAGLATALHALGIEQRIVSLTTAGPFGESLATLGIPIVALGMSNSGPNLRSLRHLYGILRDTTPDVVHCWMYHANLIGGLAARAARNRHILWSIRHTDVTGASLRRTTVWVARLCARLSKMVPAHIVYNAESSRRAHSALGFEDTRASVVPNGFDLIRFAPDSTARTSVRAELQLPATAVLIGLIARFDPSKDHRTFLTAISLLSGPGPAPHALLAGSGITADNQTLVQCAHALGIASRVHFLGRRTDIPRLTAALDAAVSSSRTEAFSSTVGEAMACGVPCVATDVGDSRMLLGGHGFVVPPGTPEALADAIRTVINMPSDERQRLSANARRRIAAHFSLDSIAHRYLDLYESILHPTA